LEAGELMTTVEDKKRRTENDWIRSELRRLPHSRARFQQRLTEAPALGRKPRTIRHYQRMIEYCNQEEARLLRKLRLSDRAEITICG
jgi:hypothetical protein